MFNYALSDGSAAPVSVVADSRDVAAWERSNKMRRVFGDLDRPAMADHLAIAYHAAQRLGVEIFRGWSAERFEQEAVLTIRGRAETDPTN